MRKLFIPTTQKACSPFDADAFMSQTFEGELDTTVAVPPEGDYRAMIGDVKSDTFRTFVAKSGKNEGKEFTIFEPSFILQDDPRLAEVKAARNSDEVSVRHAGIFIDLTEQGGLDFSKGRNVDLGRLRDAVGQNQMPNWSFQNLSGAGPVMVKVTHRSDQTDNTKKFAQVSRIVKIS